MISTNGKNKLIIMQNSLNLVKQLVHDFKSQQSYYLSPGYQEQEARKDFIDKFFMALGWDVNHERQKNPYEQEVRIEKSVKSGKTQRRADYAFYITPNFRDPKFFVEAKKPYLNLSDPDHYYQAIRYGWNKKIPISLLTDFEEFHILDCRFMPDIATIMSRKIEYIHYEQYADEETFARIFHLFGREAVANGSIEKFAASLPKPKGKAVQQALFKTGYKPIDEAFLERLDEYRLILAKSFKKHNQQLESEELTEAVQRTIDRLVFIRFLEDKSIEESRIEHLGAEPNAWKAFAQLCRSLEPKYNGLVFKPHPIIDGKDFIPPDDREFVDICDELSHEKSPYLFDEIPISILGNIYERFLGKVVHATPKRADVEEKPEVRKAGGVYYTPEYIVRYIVSNTVGKLIEGKTPDEIAPMAFADIACGSGSFLIEVYSELLEYHERWYNENPGKAKIADVQNRDGRLVLSLKKRQEILTNNIYGVDIDFQATEVTQLSLYLKLLEDVTMNDAYQFSLIKEKILPDLRNNIICGNSLIGTDILEGDLFEKSDEKKLNPMNFEDVFPKVMRCGGFDAIVGNPPYGAELNVLEKRFLSKKFNGFHGNQDVYTCFIEQALSRLKEKGCFALIVPSAWLGGPNYQPLRKVLLSWKIKKIILLPYDIFTDAYIDTLIFKTEKILADSTNTVDTYSYGKREKIISIDEADLAIKAIKQQTWIEAQDNKFILDPFVSTIIDRIRSKTSITFESILMTKRGVLFDKTLLTEKKKTDLGFKYFQGDVYRYHTNLNIKYWIEFDDKIKERPKETIWFEGERILLRRLVNRQQRLMASIVNERFITNKNLYSILRKSDDCDYKYILGIINSKLISFLYINQITQAVKDDFPQITIKDFQNLPFPNPEKKYENVIVRLVEQILSAKEQLSIAKTDAERNRLEMLCNSLDRQIDQAVYELYGLTEEEIKVVEGEK